MSNQALFWIDGKWQSLEVDNADNLDGKDSLDFSMNGHKHFKSEITDLPSVVTTTQDGFMSAADKTKLNNIAVNANNYIHPSDVNTRHVSDTQINTWNAKANTVHNHDQQSVLEVGQYIDFHKSGSTADYDTRIYVDNNSNFRVVSGGTDMDIVSEVRDLKAAGSGSAYDSLNLTKKRHFLVGEDNTSSSNVETLIRIDAPGIINKVSLFKVYNPSTHTTYNLDIKIYADDVLVWQTTEPMNYEETKNYEGFLDCLLSNSRFEKNFYIISNTHYYNMTSIQLFATY